MSAEKGRFARKMDGMWDELDAFTQLSDAREKASYEKFKSKQEKIHADNLLAIKKITNPI